MGIIQRKLSASFQAFFDSEKSSGILLIGRSSSSSRNAWSCPRRRRLSTRASVASAPSAPAGNCAAYRSSSASARAGESFCRSARNAAMAEFMGTEATLYIDRGRYEIIPDWNKKIPPEELVLGSGRRGADFYDKPDGELLHLTNWVECVRSRKTPNAPGPRGHGASKDGSRPHEVLESELFAETILRTLRAESALIAAGSVLSRSTSRERRPL